MATRNSFNSLWSSRGLLASNAFMEMQREMNRLFGDAFRRGAPRLDVRESDDEVCVMADVPGMTPADIDLRIDGSTLTLTAERHGELEQREQNYHMMERSRGLMRRSVQLPFAPDPEAVRANYENGVLTVHLPKSGQLQRGRRIDVQGADAASASGDGNVTARTYAPSRSAEQQGDRSSEPQGPGTTAGGAV